MHVMAHGDVGLGRHGIGAFVHGGVAGAAELEIRRQFSVFRPAGRGQQLVGAVGVGLVSKVRG
jgi:hypothetical protein